MKQLTNSDQVNIESYKELLTMLQNDITDTKNNTSLNPGDKAREVFKLTRQRIQLINNAVNNYPQIDWIIEALGEYNKIKKYAVKLNIENRLGLN